ncbi:hypothetical protein DKX38_011902 [Salix brachista]|uniref:Uncharacterized protein n=1 Tax=Salix brachista TaxID=2182728 RepID=A0A5N5M2V3_9ROSI|nr:hypothetical protein DKX38_011902 [Salix brachista]
MRSPPHAFSSSPHVSQGRAMRSPASSTSPHVRRGKKNPIVVDDVLGYCFTILSLPYLKVKEQRLLANVTMASIGLQYKSNLVGIVREFESTKITKSLKMELMKTPFWTLIKVLEIDQTPEQDNVLTYIADSTTNEEIPLCGKKDEAESLEQRSILSRGAERQLLQTQINPLHGSSYNSSNSSHYDVRSKAPPPVAVRSRPRDAEELISEAILLSLQSLPSCRKLIAEQVSVGCYNRVRDAVTAAARVERGMGTIIDTSSKAEDAGKVAEELKRRGELRVAAMGTSSIFHTKSSLSNTLNSPVSAQQITEFQISKKKNSGSTPSVPDSGRRKSSTQSSAIHPSPSSDQSLENGDSSAVLRTSFTNRPRKSDHQRTDVVAPPEKAAEASTESEDRSLPSSLSSSSLILAIEKVAPELEAERVL